MGVWSDAVFGGLTAGLYNTANLLSAGTTSYIMDRTGTDPFFTTFVDLDSPSGFASWAHPSYASPMNMRLNAAGFDTTWAPLTSALTAPGGLFDFSFGYPYTTSSWLGGGLYDNWLWSSSYPTVFDTHLTVKSHTPLGTITRFNGWC